VSFTYHGGQLHCEGVPLAEIARQIGTPFYVYSLDEVTSRYAAYERAFPGALICYAYKANSNLTLCRRLARCGAGADVVSGGELYIALRAGVPAQRIVFNGNGKTQHEIAYALESGVLALNVDSAEELALVAEMARDLAAEKGRMAPIAVRVNPDIDPGTHPHLATALREGKFGVPLADALELYQQAAEMPGVRAVGVHCHLGSQITSVEPYVEAAGHLRDLVIKLRDLGIGLEHVNLGGGLGIRYASESAPAPDALAAAVLPIVRDLGCSDTPCHDTPCRLILEPGRSIVGAAGALVAQVVGVKRTAGKTFVVLDAGMNALLRPALYGAHHRVWSVREGLDEIVADVVGPICESADVLAWERTLPALSRGDLVAFMDAGAYGFSMASQYNGQPRPAEVVVRGDRFAIARRRETLADLVGQADSTLDKL